MRLNQLPIVCLTGPTAVGKSQLAIDLAQIIPCDIISVDSVMVYRGMDIGTAKPDAEILNNVPHRLVNIRDPIDSYSAGDFFRDAQQTIRDSLDQKRIPLLVGGTMLYFNTLRRGLIDLPLYNEHRDYPHLKAELETMDTSVLYSQLQKYDPCTAKRLHVNDRQRIQRALLVYYLSGKPLSELHQSSQRCLPYAMTWIGLYPESREKLRETIAVRFKEMLTQGFIEEAKELYDQPDFSYHLPAYRAVGYRQIWDYLVGEIDYSTLESRGIIATCQLAKHQLTWLRAWPELAIFNAKAPSLLAKVKQHIEAQITT
jgi:tRNA dimethylallyltransferase